MELVHWIWSDVHANEPFSVADAFNLKISQVVFSQFLGDARGFPALLEDLDVPKEDHNDLFEICDVDSDGAVSIADLVAGIRKLRGEPRRSDLVYMMLRVSQLSDEVRELKNLHTRHMKPHSKQTHDLINVLQAGLT